MATALSTVQDYVTDARVLLQDTIAPYRYEDDSLLTALNVTILEGRRLRPDLFIDLLHNLDDDDLPQFAAIDTTPFVMQAMFRLAFLHGMVGHALERDQEDIQDDRSTSFMNVFNSLLIGVRQAPLARPKR